MMRQAVSLIAGTTNFCLAASTRKLAIRKLNETTPGSVAAVEHGKHHSHMRGSLLQVDQRADGYIHTDQNYRSELQVRILREKESRRKQKMRADEIRKQRAREAQRVHEEWMKLERPLTEQEFLSHPPTDNWYGTNAHFWINFLMIRETFKKVRSDFMTWNDFTVTTTTNGFQARLNARDIYEKYESRMNALLQGQPLVRSITAIDVWLRYHARGYSKKYVHREIRQTYREEVYKKLSFETTKQYDQGINRAQRTRDNDNPSDLYDLEPKQLEFILNELDQDALLAALAETNNLNLRGIAKSNQPMLDPRTLENQASFSMLNQLDAIYHGYVEKIKSLLKAQAAPDTWFRAPATQAQVETMYAKTVKERQTLRQELRQDLSDQLHFEPNYSIDSIDKQVLKDLIAATPDFKARGEMPDSERLTQIVNGEMPDGHVRVVDPPPVLRASKKTFLHLIKERAMKREAEAIKYEAELENWRNANPVSTQDAPESLNANQMVFRQDAPESLNAQRPSDPATVKGPLGPDDVLRLWQSLNAPKA